MIDQFFIVNRSGGMIFRYERSGGTDINSLLVLTSTLYSVNLISLKLVDKSAGNQTIHFGKRVITIFRTVTGIVFIFVAEKQVNSLFEKIYSHYCDYVMKNPFYQMDMPINCVKFAPQLLFSQQPDHP